MTHMTTRFVPTAMETLYPTGQEYETVEEAFDGGFGPSIRLALQKLAEETDWADAAAVATRFKVLEKQHGAVVATWLFVPYQNRFARFPWNKRKRVT